MEDRQNWNWMGTPDFVVQADDVNLMGEHKQHKGKHESSIRR
jgi:hypothetical protein